MSPRLIGFLCESGAHTFYTAPSPVLRRLPRDFQALPVVHLRQIKLADVMKAFRLGAEGVLLLGCEACKENREEVERQHEDLLQKLEALGITSVRCSLEWCSASEPENFFEAVATMRARVHSFPRLRLPRTNDEIIVPCG
ncbi:MAG: hydrogenase iron-sulfur subunit [candidate division KSB1 bacterium]